MIGPYEDHVSSVLFSVFDDNFGNDVEFEDPYASQLAVHCGVKPFDPLLDSFHFSWHQPGKLAFRVEEPIHIGSINTLLLDQPSLFNYSELWFSAHFAYHLPDFDTALWAASASSTQTPQNHDYIFGGPISSDDASPTIQSPYRSISECIVC